MEESNKECKLNVYINMADVDSIKAMYDLTREQFMSLLSENNVVFNSSFPNACDLEKAINEILNKK